jgi:flavin reductase (DIM6/NTAB) family NADH-FMN oxidoreductase RutF
MGLTAIPSAVVNAPAVAESPVSIECRVKNIVPLGTHDMFIADVVNVLVDEEFIDTESGKLDMEKARPLAYCHGEYFGLGKALGHFGWSVRKKPRKKAKVRK